MQTNTTPAAGTEKLPASMEVVTTPDLQWDHFIKPEHARQLRVQAAAWRADSPDMEDGGYVVVFEREVVGWTMDLRAKGGWRTGCIALPSTPDASFFIAVGGNVQDGADKWVVLDIRENARRQRPTPEPVRPAPKTARQELISLVTWALDNRYCSTAETIRALLLSLYNGSDNRCDLSGVQSLDNSQRRALAAVILGIGRYNKPSPPPPKQRSGSVKSERSSRSSMISANLPRSRGPLRSLGSSVMVRGL